MGQYITLSHKWDKETETSQTTAANYICRMGNCLQETDHRRPCTSGIDRLPRLFAETCILAYDLGIKYVWIDSICIKQGDDEDWNRESPRMARYYQNAWITVAAANKTAHHGLLNVRRTEPVPRMTRLPYMDINGEQKGYFYLQRARPDVLQEQFSVGVEKSDLLRRGWVFQEWRLSRRIIAFSDSGFFLHCHTLGSVSPIGDHLNGPGVGLGRNSKFDHDIMEDQYLSPLVDWEDIVSRYSGLELTYLAKDRLMALAGIANEIGRTAKALQDTDKMPGLMLNDDLLACRYVCGLWLINIHDGLLWEQATQGSRERLPGIPTWSWASMASHVTDENHERVLVGMSVRWPKWDSSVRQRWRACAAVRKATTIPVDDQNWLPQFSHHPVLENMPEYEYGNENRFVVLTIHGSLQVIQIEGFLSEEDAEVAHELTLTTYKTGYKGRYTGRSISRAPEPKAIAPYRPWTTGLWRGVCFLSNPGTITGWASVEHPELQSLEETTSCSGSIYALFVARGEEKGGWFTLANFIVSRVIFSVLLLRRVSVPGFQDCFERVGVGRVFGEEAERQYLSTEKTTISLV